MSPALDYDACVTYLYSIRLASEALLALPTIKVPQLYKQGLFSGDPLFLILREICDVCPTMLSVAGFTGYF